MFIASTTAVMGERIFEVCPNITEDFWIFDSHFLSMFFGLPRFFSPDGWDARNRLIESLTNWIQVGVKEYEAAGLGVPDPEDGRDWDPYFGARITRARHALFQEMQMTLGGQASQHLGFLFGLSSNAIPTAGWVSVIAPDFVWQLSVLPREYCNELVLNSSRCFCTALIQTEIQHSIHGFSQKQDPLKETTVLWTCRPS